MSVHLGSLYAAVHLKTYPAPWALTIWLNLAAKSGRFNMKKVEVPWSLDGILLGFSSFITFITLTMASYNLYGEEFLEHAHLHHLSRQDTRHNFSVSTRSSFSREKQTWQFLIFKTFHYRFGSCHFIFMMVNQFTQVAASYLKWSYLSLFRSNTQKMYISLLSYRHLCL